VEFSVLRPVEARLEGTALADPIIVARHGEDGVLTLIAVEAAARLMPWPTSFGGRRWRSACVQGVDAGLELADDVLLVATLVGQLDDARRGVGVGGVGGEAEEVADLLDEYVLAFGAADVLS
jgi:hypothetical protein